MQLVLPSQLLVDLQGKELLGVPITQPLLCAITPPCLFMYGNCGHVVRLDQNCLAEDFLLQMQEGQANRSEL